MLPATPFNGASVYLEYSFSSDHAKELYNGELTRAHPDDAGLDLRSTVDDFLLKPGEQRVVSSGIRINIRGPGAVALVVPRSGLGTKGLVLGNLVGTIDSGYQGDVFLTLWNRHDAESGKDPIEVKMGDRVAQLILVPTFHPNLHLVSEFKPSQRGTAGMGSTGSS